MSRLEELIQQLCPDGVEYQKIGDVCSTITDYTAAGSFADIAKNVKYITNAVGYAQLIRTTDLKSGFSKADSYIYVDEHAFKYLWRVNLNSEGLVLPNVGNCGEVYYIHPDIFPNQNNVLGPNAIWVKSDSVLNRYLYHLFLSKEFQRKLAKIISPTGQTKFNKTNFRELLIPVPPMKIQREIVRILDQFTKLTAELIAELTARKKQYEYYRDKLLTQCNTQKVELRQVVKKSCSGATPAKGHSEYYENGTIPWLRTQDVRFNEIYRIDSFITEEAVKQTAAKWIPKNCVIVAISGASAGRCAINKIKTTTNQHCLNMEIDESKALYKYVYYCVANQYQELLSRKQGARGDLNSSLILGLQIPLPTLEEQHRIVSILDRFDTLCNDLTSGLPAEIEARRKQYEYYRDKLLSFPQISSQRRDLNESI